MEVISQRQLRNASGEILRRAAAGERFRIRSGSVEVDLHVAHRTAVEHLTAAGRLSPATPDDFADFAEPDAGREPLDETMDAIRAER